MQSPSRIIVRVPKRFNDEAKGFYIDTSYKPEHYSVICGEVVATAKRLPRDFDKPGFYDTVSIGDKLYFHYLVVLDPDCHLFEDYYIVDYFQALATVKSGGELLPVGEHLLVEPIKEEVTHGTIIIPEMSKKKETNRGLVISSNDPEIPNGSTVLFEEHAKFLNEIEGREMYVMYNSNVLGIL